jgi:hypothetical protein
MVIVTVHEDNEDVIDELSDLPFVKSVHYDTIVTQDAIVWEDINIAASKREQFTTGLVKYLSYYREGLRSRIVPWTDNGFDYAVPVETQRDGTGIYVCIMDSGIEPTQSEFTDRTIIALPRRGLNSIGPHGTACAQHVGGNTFGLAPGCTFIDANCFGNSGTTATSNIIASMGDLADYVAANLVNGEIVVNNMSFGGTSDEFTSALDEMQSLGIIQFGSSGNGSEIVTGNSFPAHNLPYGAVGALDYNLQRSWFSNWGPNVFCHHIGQWIPFKGRWDDPTDESVTILISGTSFSCPFTVGCFVTWVAGKKAPTNKAECEFLQKLFIAERGLGGYIKDQYGQLDLSKAVFITADNSTPTETLYADSPGLSASILYNDRGLKLGAKGLAPYITYGGVMTDYLLSNSPGEFAGTKMLTAGRFPADYADHGIFMADGQTTQIPTFGLNEYWLSCYIYVPTIRVTSSDWFALYLAGADNIGACYGWMMNFGRMEGFYALNGNTPNLSNNTNIIELTIQENILVRLDIFVRKQEALEPRNSTIKIYINGVLVHDRENFQRFTINNLDRQYADYWMLDLSSFPIENATDNGVTISNIRVSSTSTLDKDFYQIPLTALGEYDEFGGAGRDGIIDPTAFKVLTSTVAGQRVSAIVDHAAIPDNGVISEVKLVSKAGTDSATPDPNAIAHFVRSGVTNYDQALQEITSYQDSVLTTLETNPATGVAWVLADFNGLEFGLLSGNVA